MRIQHTLYKKMFGMNKWRKGAENDIVYEASAEADVFCKRHLFQEETTIAGELKKIVGFIVTIRMFAVSVFCKDRVYSKIT